MKSSNWIVYVVIALTLVGTCCVFMERNRGSTLLNYSVRDTLAVGVNPWQPYLSIPFADSENIYEVAWDQKYGATKKEYCMAIFKNEKERQYKLVAPWITSLTIELQNTNDVRITKVARKDVPNYQLYK